MLYYLGKDFNPRSHEGSDVDSFKKVIVGLDISIRAPTRGATHTGENEETEAAIFQSALPRGERQRPQTTKTEALEISIRAPTRGATCNR